MKQLLIMIIKCYQRVISPYMRNNCRFYPSCSHYGIQALQIWGLYPGIKLLIKRLIKCHPFGQSGIDFVPQKDLQLTTLPTPSKD